MVEVILDLEKVVNGRDNRNTRRLEMGIRYGTVD